ncbi:hypothetical protein [Saccharopolyspora spinosa]|uniref:Uncharacterized protein n=1 Tax=Saccharopolyspora spinosa TaxID=60894 RepID=A0A2N3Y582_SACSN|nr:hypothetical protein [Saccharopolyspora spinosa]PKW18096.1 hypothetical protein A8926_6157 [Saccharopolyspora spinosa]
MGGVALFSTAFGLDVKLRDYARIRTANYRLDRKPERVIELTKHVPAGALRLGVGAELALEEAPSALNNGVEVTGSAWLNIAEGVLTPALADLRQKGTTVHRSPASPRNWLVEG